MPISLTNPKKQLQKGTQSICTDTLYESAHINHSKVAVVTAATHIQIGRRMITATCIQIRVAAVLWRISRQTAVNIICTHMY